MTKSRAVDAITPGDHFSPLTGSAIPTVVDGIARAALRAGDREHAVVLGSNTYAERYDSAAILEHSPTSEPGAGDRRRDQLDGLFRAARPRAAAALAPMLRDQHTWGPSAILAHNLVELVPLVDSRRHRPVLYAHNDLLRTYTRRDAGRALGDVERVVCVSRFLAERTARRLPRTLRDRVVHVNNGVDCAQFRPAEESSVDPRLRVVFIGRMIRDKGAHVLLEAVSRLGRDDIAVTVVGSAPASRRPRFSRRTSDASERSRTRP